MCIYFAIFSFVGWICESTICSLTEHKLVDRGFLKGPFIPLYGFGGIMVVYLLAPLKDNILLLYIMGVIFTSILEYITGWLMESVFGIKLWDYSDKKFNIKGRVWLLSSLFWGFLSIFAVYVLYPPFEKLFERIDPKHFRIYGLIIIIYFAVDSVTSSMTLVSIRKKIDELSLMFNDALEDFKLEQKYKYDRRVGWLNEYKDLLKLKRDIYADETRIKVENFENKLKDILKVDWMSKRMLNSYPNLTGKDYKQRLTHLWEYVKNRKDEK